MNELHTVHYSAVFAQCNYFQQSGQQQDEKPHCQQQDLLLQASPTRLVGTSPQQALQEDIPQQALQKTLQNLTCRKSFHNKHCGKHSTGNHILCKGLLYQLVHQTYDLFLGLIFHPFGLNAEQREGDIFKRLLFRTLNDLPFIHTIYLLCMMQHGFPQVYRELDYL